MRPDRRRDRGGGGLGSESRGRLRLRLGGRRGSARFSCGIHCGLLTDSSGSCLGSRLIQAFWRTTSGQTGGKAGEPVVEAFQRALDRPASGVAGRGGGRRAAFRSPLAALFRPLQQRAHFGLDGIQGLRALTRGFGEERREQQRQQSARGDGIARAARPTRGRRPGGSAEPPPTTDCAGGRRGRRASAAGARRTAARLPSRDRRSPAGFAAGSPAAGGGLRPRSPGRRRRPSQSGQARRCGWADPGPDGGKRARKRRQARSA